MELVPETWTVCTVQGMIKLFFLWQQRLHLSRSLGKRDGTTQPSEEGGQLEKVCSGCSREKKSICLSSLNRVWGPATLSD